MVITETELLIRYLKLRVFYLSPGLLYPQRLCIIWKSGHLAIHLPFPDYLWLCITQILPLAV